MKEKLIFLMERALAAYSLEQIIEFFDEVKQKGLWEHGFPRLTANIGILIAHGRRTDLLPLYLEMMEFCCKNIPNKKAANDFSVREIISCLWEVEQAGIVSNETLDRWKTYLRTIDPIQTYDRIAITPTDDVRNWATFSAVSEYFRMDAGLCDATDFVELQMENQLQWLDEKGMYMDKKNYDNFQPVGYDIVPRGLFAMLLNQGYRGKHYDILDENVKKTALLTLDMQSPNGEISFGGRSSQFLHNEPWLMVIYEYEAKRYMKEGNMALAAKFKAASARALSVTESWLSREPIRHIKNRFPTETQYGCEDYAYFNKYMITVASILHAAYIVCDDTIPFTPMEDTEPSTAITTYHFHKLFAKAGGYGLEFDWDADPQYDASGLGRIHRAGAPSVICLSVPCPAHPKFTLDIADTWAFSLSSGVQDGNTWQFGAEEGCRYEVLDHHTDEAYAYATLSCRFTNGQTTQERYQIGADGVSVTVTGSGTIGYTLPVLWFDGEKNTVITTGDHDLTIAYEGWLCRYETDGQIAELGKIAANRNGHYRAFVATASDTLQIKVTITKQ